jgi:aspartyl-tRNA(Asn)/glutamyl-tRNA(Gln) amidotransferase subunit A
MLYHKSGHEISQDFRNGKFSAQQIARIFLDRIDKCDPKIKAFIEVFHTRVMNKARQLDLKKEQGLTLGSLAAVPIAIKDNIHVEGEITTCSSKILANFRAPFSATAIEHLEKADALIMGKTNMDEFGMGSSTENSAFFSSKNPWNLNYTPGGSSGGSAAAVAARMVPIALGSDTGGSIRQPAAFCGIFGYKPSYGLVSRWGLVAYASSLDVIGAMTHNMHDLELVMQCISGSCEYDSTCLNSSLSFVSQIDARPLSANSLSKDKKIKLGIPYPFLEALNQEAKDHFFGSLSKLQEAEIELVAVNLESLKHSIEVYYLIASAEAATNLARYDGIRYGQRSSKASSLDEVYRFSREENLGREVKRRILIGNFSLSSDQQEAFFRKSQKVRQLIINQYNEAFEHCDLICMPTTPTTAFELGAIKDPLQMYLGDIYTTSVNLAALPAISLPTGFDTKHMPWGLQLIGKHHQDVKLLQIANQFDALFQTSGCKPRDY